MGENFPIPLHIWNSFVNWKSPWIFLWCSNCCLNFLAVTVQQGENLMQVKLKFTSFTCFPRCNTLLTLMETYFCSTSLLDQTAPCCPNDKSKAFYCCFSSVQAPSFQSKMVWENIPHQHILLLKTASWYILAEMSREWYKKLLPFWNKTDWRKIHGNTGVHRKGKVIKWSGGPSQFAVRCGRENSRLCTASRYIQD